MGTLIEIRVGVFVDADTATPLEHKQAVVLASQRMRNRTRISGFHRGEQQRPKPTAEPTIDGMPVGEHMQATAQRFFDQAVEDLSRPQLQVLMDFYRRQAERHTATVNALDDERYERLGAGVVQFPGGGAR